MRHRMYEYMTVNGFLIFLEKPIAPQYRAINNHVRVFSEPICLPISTTKLDIESNQKQFLLNLKQSKR